MDDDRDNEALFERLLHHAERESWCVRWGCTTCGARDFRRALKQLDGGVAEALRKTDPFTLQTADLWRDGTMIALHDVGVEGRSDVLRSWLPRLRDDARPYIRLADVILFYVVRRMALDPSVAGEWVEVCEAIAEETGDASLVESLVYTLRGSITERPGLLALAERVAERDSAVQKALIIAGVDRI